MEGGSRYARTVSHVKTALTRKARIMRIGATHARSRARMMGAPAVERHALRPYVRKRGTSPPYTGACITRALSLPNGCLAILA